MVVVVTSVIAVLGTLLGASLSHLLQSRTTARSERFARGERLRQERIDAYCTFGGALANYRRGQMDYWYPRHDGRTDDPADLHELRREAQRLRAGAMEAMFRVELLTDAPALPALARRAMDAVDRIPRAGDRDELEIARNASRTLIHEFIAASRPHVQLP
ncbi:MULTISPECIES: hypothetical protein [unclassified Streptomyces]|uniref:hypothetical protein n=1 Tax=unclassified Streptomyces TaxID=2593676 RepID=UPI000DB8FBF9|nr:MULTISPECIES: hypothetical protein [unclassified Streptomyces]MYT70787.1 hypothetical protein [Streptomyces sp. SID8367]RAJ90492.1 hypothetical protein K377_01117 [Streptomyces sp. PsTaAH-137]